MGKNGRTPMLEALCLLSFIGSGTAFLVYLTAAIFNPIVQKWIGILSSIDDPTRLHPVYFILFALLYLLSLIGVMKMWHRKKSGFFYYTGAQAVILILPYLWMGIQSFSAVATIFTLLFISLYMVQVRKW